MPVGSAQALSQVREGSTRIRRYLTVFTKHEYNPNSKRQWIGVRRGQCWTPVPSLPTVGEQQWYGTFHGFNTRRLAVAEMDEFRPREVLASA